MAVGSSHFSPETIRILARMGVRIVGLQAIPDEKGSFENSRTGYRIVDNGVGKVVLFEDLLRMAGTLEERGPLTYQELRDGLRGHKRSE